MNEKQQKQIITLDEFDNTISLYQLIPSGAGRGLSHLKLIVDAVLNKQSEDTLKPLSLLIAGKQATRTHARCFLRALGLEMIAELPAHLLIVPPHAIYEFFHPISCFDSYLISHIDQLYPTTLKTLYELLTKGEYTIYNYVQRTKELVPIFNPIVMTTHNKNKVPDYFLEKIEHVVQLEEYNDQELLLAVLQRIKYCHINYEEEKVLWLIVEYGQKNLHKIIRLLKSSITVMISDNRTTLTVEDVKKVMAYS